MNPKDDWYTPSNIIWKLEQEFAVRIDYDPATTKEVAKRMNIEHYDTIETDGLKQDWTKYKTLWINPPFTLKKEFLKKAVDTWKESGTTSFYLIRANAITNKYVYDYLVNIPYAVIIPKGRINFISDGKKFDKGSHFGSLILCIGEASLVHNIDLEENNGNN